MADKKADLLAEILQHQSNPTKCTVPQALASLTEAERAAVTEALAGPVTGTAIAKFLQSRGADIAAHTIQRHRRGVCRCARGC